MVWGPEETDRLTLYLGLGLGLGLLVADTSYAPRGILNIEKREGRMLGAAMQRGGCVREGEDTWVQGRTRASSVVAGSRGWTACRGVGWVRLWISGPAEDFSPCSFDSF